MFSLMDRVEHGIDEMLHYLEEHIKNQGLADMVISASIITTVRIVWLIKMPLIALLLFCLFRCSYYS
jgi:hypothetical protein